MSSFTTFSVEDRENATAHNPAIVCIGSTGGIIKKDIPLSIFPYPPPLFIPSDIRKYEGVKLTSLSITIPFGDIISYEPVTVKIERIED